MSKKRLYNYLVNEYGLSDEKVRKAMNDRFKNLELRINGEFNQEMINHINNHTNTIVNRYLNSITFHNNLQEKILKILKYGFPAEKWNEERLTVDKFIKDRVSELIQKEIEKQFKEKFKND